MKKIYLIGIGPGDPKYLTLEAIETIKSLKTFIIPLKGNHKQDLTNIRKNILNFVHKDKNYTVIELPFPERKRGVDYKNKVKMWRKEKAHIIAEFLKKEHSLKEAGYLIIGDPAFYDGHIEIFKEVQKSVPLQLKIIPGISAMQVLSAKYQLSLSKIGDSIFITTPRNLRKLKKITHTTVVFLDNYETFKLFKDQSLEIYWGAYLGTQKEKLLCGELKNVAETISQTRKQLKSLYHYLMEIYILRPKENE